MNWNGDGKVRATLNHLSPSLEESALRNAHRSKALEGGLAEQACEGQAQHQHQNLGNLARLVLLLADAGDAPVDVQTPAFASSSTWPVSAAPSGPDTFLLCPAAPAVVLLALSTKERVSWAGTSRVKEADLPTVPPLVQAACPALCRLNALNSLAVWNELGVQNAKSVQDG